MNVTYQIFKSSQQLKVLMRDIFRSSTVMACIYQSKGADRMVSAVLSCDVKNEYCTLSKY